MTREIFFIALVLVFIFEVANAFGQKTKPKVRKSEKTEKVQSVSAKSVAEEGEWKEVTSDYGNFKIQFPSKPKKSGGPSKYSPDKKYTEFVMATNFLKYSVSFADFNLPELSNGEITKKLYDKISTDAPSKLNATLISQGNFLVDGVVGLELILTDRSSVFVNRYIIKRKRMYQLLTTTRKELADAPNIQEYRKKFLESFQFVAK